MITIDEAIAHAREVASEQRRRSGTCTTNDNECDKFSNCMKCAEEYEQLAEWLEELKAIKSGDIPIIHGKEELELHDKAIRNKAIDDLMEKVSECFISNEDWDYLLEESEKLKEMESEKND